MRSLSLHRTRHPFFLLLALTVLSLLLPPAVRAGSIGSITTGSQTWGGGGGLFWDINDADGTAGNNWDLLSVNGGLNIDATAENPFTIYVFSNSPAGGSGLAADFVPTSSYSFNFLTTTLGITNFNPASFAFNLSNFQNPFDGTWSVARNGNNLALNYAAESSVIPIPEGGPSVSFLAGMAALFIVHGLRSRRTAGAIAAKTP